MWSTEAPPSWAFQLISQQVINCVYGVLTTCTALSWSKNASPSPLSCVTIRLLCGQAEFSSFLPLQLFPGTGVKPTFLLGLWLLPHQANGIAGGIILSKVEKTDRN